MPKDKLTDYSATNASNTDVGGVNIDEGMLPSAVNNAIRELMTHQANAFGAGTPLYVDETNNRVGIGTTSPATATGGGIDIERAGGASVRLDDTTNTVTGELQVYSSGMNLATTTNHNIIISPNNSEVARFTTNGLTFNGDTASANALDDYEEGTWTPTIGNGTVSASYASYTKIGDTVHLRVTLSVFSDRSSGSAIVISGLPFTSASNSKTSQGILGRYINSGGDAIIAYIGESRAEMYFFTTNQSDLYTQVQHNHLSSTNASLFVTITYIA